MKKRFLFLPLATFCLLMQSVAQDGIAIPNYTKFLKITNNVNLRQEPNTTCAKLMLQMEEVEGYDKLHPSYLHKGYTWGNAGGKYVYRPASADYLMVFDETSEWYHGYALLSNNEIKEVYISRKAAKVKPATKITEQYLKKCVEDCGITYSIRYSGEYSGYYVISGDMYSLQSSDNYLYIGKNNNGVFFGKLFKSEYNDESKKSGFSKLPSNINLKNLSKISDAQIKQLLKTALPGTVVFTTGIVITYFPKGSEEWNGFASYYMHE